jgi:hypothetical protein
MPVLALIATILIVGGHSMVSGDPSFCRRIADPASYNYTTRSKRQKLAGLRAFWPSVLRIGRIAFVLAYQPSNAPLLLLGP